MCCRLRPGMFLDRGRTELKGCSGPSIDLFSRLRLTNNKGVFGEIFIETFGRCAIQVKV